MKFPVIFLRFAAVVAGCTLSFPAYAADAPKKVLVVTVTTGFRHSSIPVAEKVLEQLARENGRFTVEFVRQPEGLPKPPSPPGSRKGTDDAAHQAALKKFEVDERAYKAAFPRVEAALQKLSAANRRNYGAVIFGSTEIGRA